MGAHEIYDDFHQMQFRTAAKSRVKFLQTEEIVDPQTGETVVLPPEVDLGTPYPAKEGNVLIRSYYCLKTNMSGRKMEIDLSDPEMRWFLVKGTDSGDGDKILLCTDYMRVLCLPAKSELLNILEKTLEKLPGPKDQWT